MRRRSPRPGCAALRWMLAGLLGVAAAGAVAPPHARAQSTDPWQATNMAETWWREKVPAFVRDSTTCCLPHLEEMRQAEQQARTQYDRSRDPSLPRVERRRAVDQLNAALDLREQARVDFRDCVFEVWRALVAESQDGVDPSAAIATACGGPVSFIENLGWRRCVDLASSPYRVDAWMSASELSGFPAYNCHFYTKTYLATLFRDAPWSPPSVFSQLDCLRLGDRHGFARVPRKRVSAGDIVLVKQPQAIPGCAWAHSGIVTEVDALGRPKTIRQKDGPNTCVVDLSWGEFKRSWLNAKGTSAIFLSHPDVSGIPLAD